MAENKQAPAIRFRGFKDDWKKIKLDSITDVRDGTHSSPSYIEKGHPFITSKNVNNGFINYESVQYISDTDYEEINKRSKVHKNDILMGMIGTIGNIALVRTPPDFAIKNVALIKDTGEVFYLYLYHCLQSTCVAKQLNENLDGGTQKFIALNKIRGLVIPVSTIEEQKAIGTFLENIDKFISLHQQKHMQLMAIKKAMLEKMFPKEGETVPEIRFAGFSEPWELRQLRKVVKEVTRNDPLSTAPVMMITATQGFIDQSERYAFNNAGESLKKYTLLHKGELAYNHGASKLRPYGSCFNLASVEEARIPYVYHCFSTKNQNPVFMSIMLNGKNVENQLRRIVSSGARMDGLLNISFDEYASITILLPTLSEQNAIANYFRNLDTLISLQQKKIDQLQHIKKAFLGKMFV